MKPESIAVERRRLPFTLIENIILEDQTLGRVDVLVYLALAKHADGQGTCWPSLTTIGTVARCGRTAVLASLAHLETRGYLKRSTRFRPDGGITSNSYQLLIVQNETQKSPVPKPPIQQADPPRPLRERAPVRQATPNYIQSEQNSKKGEKAPLPASQFSEEQVLIQLSDVPGLVHDRRFREGARKLLSQGKSPAELVTAVRAAVQDPVECRGLSFVIDRFPRWARKAQEQQRQEIARQQQERIQREREQEQERIQKELEDPACQAKLELDLARFRKQMLDNPCYDGESAPKIRS
jgi:hypothetical protein